MILSVGELVDFVYCEKDLESGFRSRKKAARGVALHRERQKSLSVKEGFEAEIFLQCDFEYDGRIFTIRGKPDGVYRESGTAVIEEIKTGAGDVSERDDESVKRHMAQAKCYAFIFAKVNSEEKVKIVLTYIGKKEEIIEEEHFFSRDELEIFFYETFSRYYRWIVFAEKRKKARDESLKEISFPHKSFRKGQENFSKCIIEAAEASKTLFVRAPTGIGKTAAAVFGAVKALQENVSEKVFYLTAKNTTKQIVQKTLGLFRDKGADIKSVVITAKSRICFMGFEVCDTEHCPYAKGYYGRVKEAVLDALENEDLLDDKKITDYGEKHRICPFEFSLDVSNYCDFVVCDYNYLFDPQVFFRRYFTEGGGKYIFLIDEAHNLPDRARDMFSAELKLSFFTDVKYFLGDEILEGCVEAVEDLFLELKNKLPEEGFWVQKEPVEEIIELLSALTDACGFWLERNYGKKQYEKVLDLYFRVGLYLKITEYYGKNYVTYIKLEGNDTILKQFCLDPSENIRNVLKKGKSAVFFSATLEPVEYYRDVLGGDSHSVILELESPFPKENLEVIIAPFISTKYASRDFSLKGVCSVLNSLYLSKKGNYIAFFPSYVYLEKALFLFEREYPETKIVFQKPLMTEAQKTKFLKSFKKIGNKGIMGFAVMGGVFSEGIDLVGEKLSGAVIVGVGLPKICFEIDIIREYFESKLEAGFEFAYMYPGMNKVLQAAGRVIRTENDKGVIILVDQRFSQERYISLFPPEWSHHRVAVSHDYLEDALREFWGRG
ncbi:ATP-dependent DNA helicase [candidate division WOR-3 bacterium]|nr:ATP-dependent DNA helicase [candidate division WOR-3 bacterium]